MATLDYLPEENTAADQLVESFRPLNIKLMQPAGLLLQQKMIMKKS
ncbi:MAG TPA: hypothetical protein VFW07_26875 [Parafilimonas sp.]|nr:hypothetical protein [Parafilimonas sp.]